MTERTDWLTWRRGGIGGSDIAQLIPGVSPWGSPYALWCDKVGTLPDDPEPSEAMRWGHLLEDIVIEEFARRSGFHIAGRQTWCVHPEYPWARCTPDGFVFETEAFKDDLAIELGSSMAGSGNGTSSSGGTSGGPVPPNALGLLEVKCSGWPADWTDGIPIHIEAQVQWQLFVTGLTQAWVAVLLQGRHLQVFEITRDESAITALARLAEDFWTNHVIAWNPPPTDGSEATSLALAATFRQAIQGIVVPLDEIETTIHELRGLREERRALDTQIKAAENRIKEALGPAEAGTLADTEAVTWHNVTTQRVDIDALTIDHPDLIARYRRPLTTRRLLIKKPNKNKALAS